MNRDIGNGLASRDGRVGASREPMRLLDLESLNDAATGDRRKKRQRGTQKKIKKQRTNIAASTIGSTETSAPVKHGTIFAPSMVGAVEAASTDTYR